MPWPARRVAATRAASCVRLKRDTPIVAPRREATRRARSSAAPRLAATIVISWCGGKRSRYAAARSSRTAADEDWMIENGRDDMALPRTRCRVSDAAVLTAVRCNISTAELPTPTLQLPKRFVLEVGPW